jgi:hypothetical protein
MGTLQERSRPKPSAERRRRRATVESMMIDGTRHMQIVAIVAEQFGTSPRTIHSDIRIFRRRWAKVDTEKAGARRERTILALERNARSCRAAGDLHGERQALRDVGRLLGMGGIQVNVHQDNRKQEVHLHQARLPQARQAWQCMARPGVDRCGRTGMARRRLAWSGLAGRVRLGSAGQGSARTGRQGLVGFG